MPDRLAASTNTYHTLSLEEALAGIAAAGFKSVELASVPGWTEHVRRDATPEHIGYVKDQLKQHDLTPISLSGHSDLLSDSGVTEFQKALNLCRQFGISYVTTSTGGHAATSEGDADQQRSEFLKRIGPLADEAAADGIVVCLETHGGPLSTGASSAKLVQEIDKPNVGINYDAGNVIYYGNTRPETDIAAAIPYIKHLHVKDKIGGVGVWNFPAVGTGEIDYAIIFSALDAAGFNGPCSIEIEFQGEPWPPVADVDKALAASYTFVRKFVPA